VFLAKKDLVTSFPFRMIEIGDDFGSYIFEPYAAFRWERLTTAGRRADALRPG